MHGLLVIDKPAGITSRDAVNRAQGWLPRGTRVGHTGTLDPLATGVLVLCIGNATRLAEYVQRMPKAYRAAIVLGARSDTDDADGTITAAGPITPPTPAQVAEALGAFVGTIGQVPPAYSAAKVRGHRAYALARRGKDVPLTPRPVTVHAIDCLRYAFPQLDIEVRCGKGTYIRALARDLGERLGCGGYIASLRRTRVGCFDVTAAVSLDAGSPTAQRALLPSVLAVSELPCLTLTTAELERLCNGQPLPIASTPTAPEVAVIGPHGDLVAVATVDAQHRCIRPDKVLRGDTAP
jgi:tRNA pseudouridine55 synthase